MKYKLFLFDIDQTLIDNFGDLQPLTRKMMDYLHEKGVYLGLASGRFIKNDLERNYKKWNLGYQFDCIVGVNGAHLYDGVSNQLIKYFELTSDEMKEIMHMMEKYDLLAHIYHDDYTLYNKDAPEVEMASKRYEKPCYVKESIDDFCEVPTAKIMYFTPLDISKEIEEYAIKMCEGKNYECVRTRDFMIEFVPKGCGKFFGAQKFAELNNFSTDEIVAFGDTSNDNDIIKNCGLGVCMLNGTDDTKALADVITDYPCSEDGVGHFIEDHLLDKI